MLCVILFAHAQAQYTTLPSRLQQKVKKNATSTIIIAWRQVLYAQSRIMRLVFTNSSQSPEEI